MQLAPRNHRADTARAAEAITIWAICVIVSWAAFSLLVVLFKWAITTVIS